MIDVTSSRAQVIGAEAHLHLTAGELGQLLIALEQIAPEPESWRAGLCNRIRAALNGCICSRHEHVPGGPGGGCRVEIVPGAAWCPCHFRAAPDA